MRKLQLLLTAFAVLVAGTFIGVSDVSAQNTGDCVQSCKAECDVLPKDEKKSCKFSCMGGRCGIPGVIVAAEATGEPGVDCSEDGECNTFCEANADPDCCAPSTTPLRAIQVPFGSVSVATLPPPYSGFEINVTGLGPQVGGYAWCSLGGFYVWDAGTSYTPNQVPSRTCVTAEQVRVQPSVDEGNPVTAAGDYLTLDYKLDAGGLSSSATVFLPELTGDLTSVMLYPAVDGSTYFDEELTQLAANACDYNACAKLEKVVVSPLSTTLGSDINLSAEASDQDGDPIEFRWTAAGGSIADPIAPVTTYTCEDAGNHEINVEVSDDVFGSCVDSWTVTVTCTTSTCEERCGWAAEAWYDECLAQGGTEVGCRALALDHFEECVAENCTPP